jgi:superfamily II DNA helicase RecQ
MSATLTQDSRCLTSKVLEMNDTLEDTIECTAMRGNISINKYNLSHTGTDRLKQADDIISLALQNNEKIAVYFEEKSDIYKLVNYLTGPLSKSKLTSADIGIFVGGAGFSQAERDYTAYNMNLDSSKLRLVLATECFCCGIDNHLCRVVICFDTPKSIMLMLQEIGRAGRDGKPAHVHINYDILDRVKQRWHIVKEACEVVDKLKSHKIEICTDVIDEARRLRLKSNNKVSSFISP